MEIEVVEPNLQTRKTLGKKKRKGGFDPRGTAKTSATAKFKAKEKISGTIKKVSKSGALKWQDTLPEQKEKDPYPGAAPIPETKLKLHSRGEGMKKKNLVVHAMAPRYVHREKQTQFAVKQSARAENLLTESTGGVDQTLAGMTQNDIVQQVDILSAQKHFELKLDKFGPYCVDYTRNGRHLLLAGRRGHIAAFDWQTKKLHCEINVMESVNDVTWLHQETMFATAQRQWCYVYDNQGVELHCLKQLHSVLQLGFLPYHFLMVAASSRGYLSFLDVSVGQKVAGYSTGLGRLDVMTHNPKTGITMLGHTGGTVTLWSPTVKEPLVKMLCHAAAVRSAAVHSSGNYLATSGVDRKLKLWDLRTFKMLDCYSIGHGAGDLHFSQRGVLASSQGRIVQMYEDPVRNVGSESCQAYMSHTLQWPARAVRFCPYEDVLGVGHAQGFSSLLVPGSGEANIDALESNPYQTKQQRKHKEVAMLLDKIPYDMISLEESAISRVDIDAAAERHAERKQQLSRKTRDIDFTPRFKAKGRSKTGNFEKRKKGFKEEIRLRNVEKLAVLEKKKSANKKTEVFEPRPLLSRFKRKT